MLLFIDVETTKLWDFQRGIDDPNQPHLVQLAAILCTPSGAARCYLNSVIQPDGWTIPEEATRIHRITTDYALAFGEPLATVVARFIEMMDTANELQQGTIVAHNAAFDINVLSAALLRCGHNAAKLACIKSHCTMRALTDRMNLPRTAYGGPKWPTLDEASAFIGLVPSRDQRHTAMGDALACREIYLYGMRKGWWPQ